VPSEAAVGRVSTFGFGTESGLLLGFDFGFGFDFCFYFWF
jgi:hypothetical protein